MAEFGNAKVDVGSPIINYSIAYDTNNVKPLFYEAYCGSIADVSQLEFMLGKAKGYGYRNIGFILDRGTLVKITSDRWMGMAMILYFIRIFYICWRSMSSAHMTLK